MDLGLPRRRGPRGPTSCFHDARASGPTRSCEIMTWMSPVPSRMVREAELPADARQHHPARHADPLTGRGLSGFRSGWRSRISPIVAVRGEADRVRVGPPAASSRSRLASRTRTCSGRSDRPPLAPGGVTALGPDRLSPARGYRARAPAGRPGLRPPARVPRCSGAPARNGGVLVRDQGDCVAEHTVVPANDPPPRSQNIPRG